MAGRRAPSTTAAAAGGGGGGVVESVKTCVEALVVARDDDTDKVQQRTYLVGHATVQKSGPVRFIFTDATGAVAFELCTGSLADSPKALPPTASTRVLLKSFNVIPVRESELSESSGASVWSSCGSQYPQLRKDVYLEVTSLVVLPALPSRQTHGLHERSSQQQPQLPQGSATTAPALARPQTSSRHVADVTGRVVAVSGNICVPGAKAAPQFLVEVRPDCTPSADGGMAHILSDRGTVFLSMRNLLSYRNAISIGQEIAIAQANVKLYSMRRQDRKIALLVVSTPQQVRLGHPSQARAHSPVYARERQRQQDLISYKGTITDTSRAACGVYRLDHSYNLYLTVPPHDRRPLGLRCGAVVLLHSVHPIFAWRHQQQQHQHQHQQQQQCSRGTEDSDDDVAGGCSGSGVRARVLAGFGCCFRTTVEVESFAGTQTAQGLWWDEHVTMKGHAKPMATAATREQTWTLPSSLVYNDYAQYFRCMPFQHYAAFLDFERHTLQILASSRASSRLRRALFSIFKINVSPPLTAPMSRNFYREFCAHATGCHLSQDLDPHSPDFAQAWVSVQTLKDRVVRQWQPHSPDSIDIDRLSDRRLHTVHLTQAALGLSGQSLVGMLVPSLWGGWRLRSGGAQVTILFSSHHQMHRFSRGDVIVASSFRVVVESMMSDIARHLDATKFRVLHIEPLSVALVPGLGSLNPSVATRERPPAKTAKRDANRGRHHRLRLVLLHRHAARRQTGFEVDAAVVRVQDEDWRFVGMASVMFPQDAPHPLARLYQMYEVSKNAFPIDDGDSPSGDWTLASTELASPVSTDSTRLFQLLHRHPRLAAYVPRHVRACLHVQTDHKLEDTKPSADTMGVGSNMLTVLGTVEARELSYSRGQEEELDILRLRLRDARSDFDRVDVYLRLSTPSDRLAGVCEGRVVALSQLIQKVSTHGSVYLEGTGSTQAVILGCAHTWMRDPSRHQLQGQGSDASADASVDVCVEGMASSQREKQARASRAVTCAAEHKANGGATAEAGSGMVPKEEKERAPIRIPAQWFVPCQLLPESERGAAAECRLREAAHVMWQLADHGCGPQTAPGRWGQQSFQELQAAAARLQTLPLQCVACTCKLLHINKAVASVRCQQCGAAVDATQGDGACECAGHGGSTFSVGGACGRRLRVRVYAECDDGTGRVFVSARDDVALSLLRCDGSQREDLLRLCLCSGEQQYTRKDGFFTNPLLAQLCEAPGIVRTVRLALCFDSVFSVNSPVQTLQQGEPQDDVAWPNARVHTHRLRLECFCVQDVYIRHHVYRLLPRTFV